MPFKRILVTTDFSPASERAFTAAAEQAKLNGANVILLHVLARVVLPVDALGSLPDPTYAESLDRIAEEASRKKLGELAKQFQVPSVETQVVSTYDHPGNVVAEFATAQKCDLIVMASQGKGALSRFFVGSTIDRVLSHARCPVLAIPPAP